MLRKIYNQRTLLRMTQYNGQQRIIDLCYHRETHVMNGHEL